MGELLRFIYAVLGHWIGLMAGVASVSVALYLRLRQRSEFASVAFWCVAIICFVGAFFLAWRDEYRERGYAETKLETLTRPRLSAEINSIAIGGRLLGVPEFPGPFLTLLLRITNTGAPTIITGWRVLGVYENGGTVSAIPLMVTAATKSLTLGSDVPGGSSVTLSPEDDLPSKTAQEPIPTGAARVGHVVTYFQDPGLDWQGIRWIRITFSDVSGASYEAEVDRRLGRKDLPPGGAPYLPGLRRPAPPR